VTQETSIRLPDPDSWRVASKVLAEVTKAERQFLSQSAVAPRATADTTVSR